MTMGRTCRTRGLGLTGPRAALAPRHGCGRAPTASTASARVRYPNDTLAETGFNPRAGARLWHQDLGRPVHEEGARCGLPTVLELAHLHGQHEVARGIDVALAAARHRVRRVVAMESPIPRAAVSADRPVLLRRWETCVLRGDRRHAVGRLHRLDELVEGVFRWLLPLLALDIADPPAEYWPHRGDAFALAVEFVTVARRLHGLHGVVVPSPLCLDVNAGLGVVIHGITTKEALFLVATHLADGVEATSN